MKGEFMCFTIIFFVFFRYRCIIQVNLPSLINLHIPLVQTILRKEPFSFHLYLKNTKKIIVKHMNSPFMTYHQIFNNQWRTQYNGQKIPKGKSEALNQWRTQYNGQKIPKGKSEAVNQWRTQYNVVLCPSLI
jgi:hypothetical protein